MKKIASLLFITSVLLVSAVGAAEQNEEKQNVLIHLSSYTDNLHAVSMALKIGRMLSSNDMSVTLFLDLEGVRLADKNQPQNLVWGTGDSIEELYLAYVNAGGVLLVCPHCAKAAGVVELRDGAVISSQKSLLMA
ncbi:MAG: DsrE family protein, partial [Gammaproteobacteria bacterium]